MLYVSSVLLAFVAYVVFVDVFCEVCVSFLCGQCGHLQARRSCRLCLVGFSSLHLLATSFIVYFELCIRYCVFTYRVIS